MSNITACSCMVQSASEFTDAWYGASLCMPGGRDGTGASKGFTRQPTFGVHGALRRERLTGLRSRRRLSVPGSAKTERLPGKQPRRSGRNARRTETKR